MPKALTESFFGREPDAVARDLIGASLVRKTGKGTKRLMIVETEAYFGEEDLASHARFGPTDRNRPMYGKPGRWYVYLIYGMHQMLNVTTGAAGAPSAVLIRGVEGLEGPGRLTKALRIGKPLNGRSADEGSGLWIEARKARIREEDISASPRIGVGYAGAWAERPYRFTLRRI